MSKLGLGVNEVIVNRSSRYEDVASVDGEGVDAEGRKRPLCEDGDERAFYLLGTTNTAASNLGKKVLVSTSNRELC